MSKIQADLQNDNDGGRQVVTRVADSRWLFNNFYIGVLIVDTREPDAAASNTLLGSVHIPPMASTEGKQDIAAHVRTISESHGPALSRRPLRELVLVGEPNEASMQWQRELQEFFVSEGVVASVTIMEEGFSVFHKRYPFYTTAHQVAPEDPTVIKRITYPNEIVQDFLYLGNMWHAKSKRIIQDLGITHIVNATLDLGNEFEGDGVRYHEVKLPDQSGEDISQFFNGTYAFMEAVRAIQPPSKHFRVLVHCTQGISRSATLVLMYLMRSHRLSLVQAFNLTHKSRPVIIPNPGFFRQLLAEERRLFQGLNSLHESEIDALLQGRLEDREATIQLSEDLQGSSLPPARSVAIGDGWKQRLAKRSNDCQLM